jgi:hypothetical protein
MTASQQIVELNCFVPKVLDDELAKLVGSRAAFHGEVSRVKF